MLDSHEKTDNTPRSHTLRLESSPNRWRPTFQGALTSTSVYLHCERKAHSRRLEHKSGIVIAVPDSNDYGDFTLNPKPQTGTPEALVPL